MKITMYPCGCSANLPITTNFGMPRMQANSFSNNRINSANRVGVKNNFSQINNPSFSGVHKKFKSLSKDSTAKIVVNSFSLVAGSLTVLVSSIPGLDYAVLNGSATSIVLSLCKLYKIPVTQIKGAASAAMAGANIASTVAEPVQYIPLVGWMVNGLVSGVLVKMVGNFFHSQFKLVADGKMNPEHIDAEILCQSFKKINLFKKSFKKDKINKNQNINM